ncbi:hypothetical protein DAEQUDRAFT_807288 [Daedalea quercina L-15889]|uniref:Mating-type protein A-alpha/beta 1 N-terminal domain-containing protein n=1 Tax=Daedalea quercina L-15889 TaxID=1314783 RepID=A0A165UJV2_9APHY|nr:hypothetical protein DAEQUDRAFT_807288 [Daedalea quercina L-15889]
MDTIRERLLSTENDFLFALDAGDAGLEAFGERWHALQEDIDAAVASHALDDHTKALAVLVASRVESFALSFEDVLYATASVEAHMESELEDVFSQLALDADEGEPSAPWIPSAPSLGTALETATNTLSHCSFDLSYSDSSASSSQSSRAPSLVSDSFSDDSESEDEDEDKIVPNISQLGKRCYKNCTADNDETARKHKRRRSSTHSSIESPAPWLWDEGNDILCEAVKDQLHMPRKIIGISSRKIVTVTPPATTALISSTQSRKRRLSNAAVDRPMKRPRDLHVEPRRQAVSNPLPLSGGNLEDNLDDLDHWATHFTVVEPATFSPPSSSTPLEIDWRGLGGSTTKVPRKSVAVDFAGICTSYPTVRNSMADLALATATEPLFDEVLEGLGVSPVDIVVPTIADVAKAIEGEVPSGAGVTTGGHLASKPEDSTSTRAEDILRPLSPSSATQVVEPTSPTPSQSTLPLVSPSSPGSDSATQSDDASPATTPSLAAPSDLSVPANANKTRSRSSSPSRTPPPSFESTTADLSSDWNLPAYSAFDQFPDTSPDTPPPPYCHSPEETSGLTHGKAFDAKALFAGLLPLAFSGKKRGFSEAFNQHMQVPRAGFAISAV